ncbi:DUF6371 domain-containing protein [Rapidithrix thailandica]|uniref:DUF6371 domain-containing protein n=1 Tax=Rapidithrix thailandica TaxID=413964 RepID=A0AAW9SDW2_9BACT
MTNYKKYQLDKSSKKYHCPACGEKKFNLYLDPDTGEPVGDEYGRCDRENSCQYHRYPSVSGQKEVTQAPGASRPEPKCIYPVKPFVDGILQRMDSPFHHFCRQQLNIPEEHLKTWLVGSLGSYTAFGVANPEKVLNFKFVPYESTGTRDRSEGKFPYYLGKSYLIKYVPEYHKVPASKAWQDYFKFERCFYGQHLFDRKKDTFLVESEKTAVLAAFFYPSYNWLAVGGNNGIKFEQFSLFKGSHRKVYYLIDNDLAGKKSKVSEYLEKFNSIRKRKDKIFPSVLLFPTSPSGWDLADEIVCNAKIREEEQFKKVLKAALSALQEEEEEEQEKQTIRFRDSGIWLHGRNGWNPVCDFNIGIKYKITDDLVNRVSWVLELCREDEEPEYLEMDNREFCSAKRFHECLMARNYVFQGTDNDLKRIQQALVRGCDGARKVPVLGFDRESRVFFFANAGFNGKMVQPDEFGIIEHDEKHYFMPYNTEEGRKTAFKNAERFLFESRKDISFNLWANLFTRANLEESYIPMFFYIASLFRDLVFDTVHFFPILFLKGPAGSGKSSIARSMTCLFGYRQHEISLKSPNTSKSLPRLLGQMSNAILWLDEYHNFLPSEVQGTLQSVYDGGGYERAAITQGVETTSVDIRSALTLTSNYLPEDTIFFSRCIYIGVDSIKKTKEQTEAYNHLQKLENGNLSAISAEVLIQRATVEKNFEKVYTWFYDRLQQMGQGKFANRLVNNMAVILTPTFILARANQITLFTGEEEKSLQERFLEIGYKNMLRQYNINSTKSDLSMFFETFQNLHDRSRFRNNIDYKFTDDGRFLALRYAKIYPEFAKEFFQIYRKTPPARQDLLDMMRVHEAFVEYKNSVRFRNNDYGESAKYSNTSAPLFNYARLKQDFLLSLDGESEY